jgi:hypothetical protein
LDYQEPDCSVPSTCFSVDTSAEDGEVMQQEETKAATMTNKQR